MITTLRVVSKAKGGKSGIHDPAGPTGSWGQGINKGRAEAEAQESNFQRNRDKLLKQEHRSDQLHQHGTQGAAGFPLHEQVSPAAKQEQASKMSESDDEYEHMSQLDKMKMILKDKLYAWLGTGAEPL